MWYALIAAVTMSIAAGVTSCWVILVGWSLLGDAVSHAILPGVVLAYIFGAPFAVGAFAAAIVAVGLVNAVKTRSTLREDTTIGIIFTACFALGLVLISLTPNSGHLEEILFGNLLGISKAALLQTVAFGLAAIVVLLFAKRGLTTWAFDPIHARTIGYSVRWVRWILLLALACVVVSSVQAVGSILVVAMLVTPGATAYLLTRNFNVMLLLSPAIAMTSSVIGLCVSFSLNISSGGSIILSQFLIFLAVYLCGSREGIVWKIFK